MNLAHQLHIFNPEHDLALAAGHIHVNPPAAAVKWRDALGFLLARGLLM